MASNARADAERVLSRHSPGRQGLPPGGVEMLMTGTSVASGLLSSMNERRVLEFVQRHGPASRAVMTRGCGMSAPTVAKAVGTLIRNGLMEETEALEGGFGRPGKLLQLSEEKAKVLGVVIDADVCWIGRARLDGAVPKDQSISFRTPESYDGLLQAVINGVGEITGHAMGGLSGRFRGVGLSVPGLFNSRAGETVMSPNPVKATTRERQKRHGWCRVVR